MLKGHIDNVLLAALDRESAHGYAILELIRLRSGGTFDLPEGTIYPALHRLEAGGYVSSEWQQPEGGRRRRVYSLTQRGRSLLAKRRDGWREFSRAIDALLARSRETA